MKKRKEETIEDMNWTFKWRSAFLLVILLLWITCIVKSHGTNLIRRNIIHCGDGFYGTMITVLSISIVGQCAYFLLSYINWNREPKNEINELKKALYTVLMGRYYESMHLNFIHIVLFVIFLQSYYTQDVNEHYQVCKNGSIFNPINLGKCIQFIGYGISVLRLYLMINAAIDGKAKIA